MCGRYSLIADVSQLAQRLEFDGDRLPFEAAYNIAPTQQVLTVKEKIDSAGRQASCMRWGLIPSWTKGMSVGNPMINARAETVAEKPAFRGALQLRRCLVLADGYYEWRRDGRIRTPFRVTLTWGEPFHCQQWPRTCGEGEPGTHHPRTGGRH